MDYVLEIYEKAREQYGADPVLGPCIDAGWTKLKKYYDLTNELPAYAAAVILNPTFKWEYCMSTWESAWLPATQLAVRKLWEKEYQPKAVTTPIERQSPVSSRLAVQPTCELFELLEIHQVSRLPNPVRQYIRSKQAVALFIIKGDEYDRYCRIPPHSLPDSCKGSAIKWWL
jgi:hypothetical protein